MFPTRPFVLKVIDLALGYTHPHWRVADHLFHRCDDLKSQAQALAYITAPSIFALIGVIVIMPLLPALLADNPTLKVDLTLSDSIIDIAGLGIDVAIRIATLRDSTLVATTLAPNHAWSARARPTWRNAVRRQCWMTSVVISASRCTACPTGHLPKALPP